MSTRSRRRGGIAGEASGDIADAGTSRRAASALSMSRRAFLGVAAVAAGGSVVWCLVDGPDAAPASAATNIEAPTAGHGDIVGVL
ncbi:hypothetical protein GCM10009806_20460 [Microbacterium flavum]